MGLKEEKLVIRFVSTHHTNMFSPALIIEPDKQFEHVIFPPATCSVIRLVSVINVINYICSDVKVIFIHCEPDMARKIIIIRHSTYAAGCTPRIILSTKKEGLNTIPLAEFSIRDKVCRHLQRYRGDAQGRIRDRAIRCARFSHIVRRILA